MTIFDCGLKDHELWSHSAIQFLSDAVAEGNT